MKETGGFLKGKPPVHSSVAFTLIELMIVVAIIGILAAVAIPHFADLARKANEGQSKANLASLRSAITIYYGDLDGAYPPDLGALTVSSQFMVAIPNARVPSYHADSNADVDGVSVTDAGGSIYDNLANDSNLGSIWINCTHTDSRNSVWTSY